MDTNKDFLDLTEILNLDEILSPDSLEAGGGCSNGTCPGGGDACSNTSCEQSQELQ